MEGAPALRSGALLETVTSPINLFLVDDHAMFRHGMARVFAKEPEFAVVGQSATALEALSQLTSSNANMVLLDVELGPERALDFVVKARKQAFHGKILVVTAGVTVWLDCVESAKT